MSLMFGLIKKKALGKQMFKLVPSFSCTGSYIMVHCTAHDLKSEVCCL